MDKKIIIIMVLVALLSCTVTILGTDAVKSGAVGKVFRSFNPKVVK